ncbi:hypothetical protein [Pseudomonas brenneri]
MEVFVQKAMLSRGANDFSTNLVLGMFEEKTDGYAPLKRLP